MAEERLVLEDGIVGRRAFLKGSLAAGLVVLVGLGATVSGCRAPAAATPDIRVTSSLDFGHTHNVTIPGADIDNPPAEKTYTSDGPTHSHAITLTMADFTGIKNGQTVSKTSTDAGAPLHTHTFAIKKA